MVFFIVDFAFPTPHFSGFGDSWRTELEQSIVLFRFLGSLNLWHGSIVVLKKKKTLI